MVIVDRPANGTAFKPGELAGYALDNAIPLRSVTARIDGGTPVTALVDDRGRFSISLPERGSRAILTAHDEFGRTATSKVELRSDGGTGVETAPMTVK